MKCRCGNEDEQLGKWTYTKHDENGIVKTTSTPLSCAGCLTDFMIRTLENVAQTIKLKQDRDAKSN